MKNSMLIHRIADWLERKLYLVEDREMDLIEYTDLYVHEDFIAELTNQFIFLGLTANTKLPQSCTMLCRYFTICCRNKTGYAAK